MKCNNKTLISLWLVSLFFIPVAAGMSVNKPLQINLVEDFDPLVDVTVTVEIQKIRSLESHDRQLRFREYVDRFSAPDFYVKVFINDVEFKSKVWKNTKYVYDPQWSATLNVPDDKEFVNVTIQLWDWEPGIDKMCDISSDAYGGIKDTYDVELQYSIKSGHWWGDDYIEPEMASADPSGYGRLNGCDDNSIYQRERDCELWFNIYQNDIDNDNIPYWTEVNVYGTDPLVDNTGEDKDADGCPIEWEHKWGHFYHWWYDEHYWFYNDTHWDDHANIDIDQDGIQNVEEYLTSQWGSDPFRKDIFLELDQMQESPNGVSCLMPEASKELLYTAYNRQNVVYHLDDGTWNTTESEMIPFDETTDNDELWDLYLDYFLHDSRDNWRRSVFRYGIIIYNSSRYHGFCFSNNAFVISAKGMEQKIKIPSLKRDEVYASAYMHETGHTLAFSPIGGHDDQSKYPWQIGWWKWRPYKSCMNYGYMYSTVDYSDGSRGKNDFDDWCRMDLTYFEQEWW